MLKTECPNCLSKAYKRNGYTRHGKQNHRCLDCGRQFCFDPVLAETAVLPSQQIFTHTLIIEKIETEELWKSGQKTLQKQWVWIALDAQVKQLVAYYVDNEGKNGAAEVWKLIPEEYRTHSRIYTDLEREFKEILPEGQHYRLFKLKAPSH